MNYARIKFEVVRHGISVRFLKRIRDDFSPSKVGLHASELTIDPKELPVGTMVFVWVPSPDDSSTDHLYFDA
jgi:hypothetical protein